MRDQPSIVGGIAREAPSQVIEQSTPSHFLERVPEHVKAVRVAGPCVLAKQHPQSVTYRSFGKSHEGAALPMLILNKSKEEKPPTFLVFANIHAGEVDGKEAVLALARELAGNDKLLEKVRIVILPNINPDGNDRFSDKNRTEQKGPPSVGIRENAH